jgi:hypothetical protein
MTLRFIDSFDDRSGDELNMKWDTNTNWIQAGGRNGTTCMDLPHAAVKIFDDQITWIVGFALYYHTNAVASFMTFLDHDSGAQMSIKAIPDGYLRVTYGAGIPIIGDSTLPLLFDEWQYVEVKVHIDDTVGTFDILRNGTSIYHVDTIDTDYTDVGSVNQIVFPSLTADDFMDDLYICDGNGSKNNDFLGDCHIEYILPNGVGTPATSEWLNSDDDTASLYTMVDENPPIGDRNYDLGASLPVKDVWAFPDLSAESNSILGIQVNCLARVEDLDTSVAMHNICRFDGTDYNSASFTVNDLDYKYYMSIWERDPTNTANWTKDSFNSAEFGYEREVV